MWILICLKTHTSLTWFGVQEKFRANLQQRGVIFLNIMRQHILIKTISSSLPLYYFMVFLSPSGILCVIAKIIRNFLWEGGKQSNKKYHLVKWVVLKSPNTHEGQEIHDQILMNMALGEILSSDIFQETMFVGKKHFPQC